MGLLIFQIVFSYFVQQMADLVTDAVKDHGTNFLVKCIPKSVRQQSNGRLQVEYEYTSDGHTKTETYDTVMTAIGLFGYNLHTHFLLSTAISAMLIQLARCKPYTFTNLPYVPMPHPRGSTLPSCIHASSSLAPCFLWGGGYPEGNIG